MKKSIVIAVLFALAAGSIAYLPQRPGQAQPQLPQFPGSGLGGYNMQMEKKPEIQPDEAKVLLEGVPGLNIRNVGGMVVLDGTIKGKDNQARIDRVAEAYANVLKLVTYAEPVEIYSAIAEEIRRKIPFPGVVVRIVEGGRLILSGYVSSPSNKEFAEKIARAYHDPVVNTIVVRESVVEVNMIFAAVNLKRLRESGTGFLRDFAIGMEPAGTYYEGSSNAAGSTWNSNWRVGVQASATIRLLRDNGYIRSLAQPHLSTVSGQIARFQQGGTRGFIVAGQGAADVEYKEYGVIVEVLPEVLAEGEIRIRVGMEVIRPDISKVDTIDFSTFRTQTEAILNEGQTLVASGIVDTIKNEYENKVPLLGDIPILNFFFNARGESYEDREMVLFVTPYLPTVLKPGAMDDLHLQQGSSNWEQAVKRADPDFYRDYAEQGNQRNQ